MFSDPVCDLGSWTPTLRRRGCWFQERVYIEGLPQSHCTKTSLIFKALNTEKSRNDGLSYPLPYPHPFRAPSCCWAWLARRYQLRCDSFWARSAIKSPSNSPRLQFLKVYISISNHGSGPSVYARVKEAGKSWKTKDVNGTCYAFQLRIFLCLPNFAYRALVQGAWENDSQNWLICLIRVPQIHD
jgi:hypothetical protein